jgi:copper transport protein
MANMSLPSGEFPPYTQTEDNNNALSSTGSAQDREVGNNYLGTSYISSGKISLSINPFNIGQNNFKVSFYSYTEEGGYVAASAINNTTLKLTQIEQGIGPILIETRRESPGVFVAEAAFGVSGIWTVQVEGEQSTVNEPNMISTFTVFVKPKLSDLAFDVEEYPLPTREQGLLLYPVYDPTTQSIWVGDTLPDSGRIWQFNTESKNYTVHPINNASLITSIVLDSKNNNNNYYNTLWYIDPINRLLGNYDPVTKENKQFQILVESPISGLAIDNNDRTLWIAPTQVNKVIKFSPDTNQFTSYNITNEEEEEELFPTSIAVDNQGDVWFTESPGKVARLNPASGNITEFIPTYGSLKEPSAILADAKSQNIYISEHEGQAVSILNPFSGLFKKIPTSDKQGLPFGMAIDSYSNLWVAQHVVDKIAVLDTMNGEIAEVNIPTTGSFIQWLTSDDKGRIWFAEQRGSAVGSITMTAKQPSSSPSPTTTAATKEDDNTLTSGISSTKESTSMPMTTLSKIPNLGFGFADIAGPLISGGIILSALFYSKSIIDSQRIIALNQRYNELENRKDNSKNPIAQK